MPEFETLSEISSNDIQSIKYYEGLLSYLRGRLNVINTSLYLVESSLNNSDGDVIKYLKKINDEMDSIRKLINI